VAELKRVLGTLHTQKTVVEAQAWV